VNSEKPVSRLKRLDRLYTSFPIYFVTINTANRKHILANDKIHNDFRNFCEAGLARGVFVGKYVLMPDHLHLFVTFGIKYQSTLAKRYQMRKNRPQGSPVAAVYDRRLSFLSEWMKSLKNTLSKTLRQTNVPSPHWQKDFFDHVIRSEESYSEKWLYVAQNPVRKKLVKRPEDWPFQGEIYPLQAQGHI
jgi:REP element-mobilizing transposase RayT